MARPASIGRVHPATIREAGADRRSSRPSIWCTRCPYRVDRGSPPPTWCKRCTISTNAGAE